MPQERVVDRWGNEIYLTDERWRHILETHEEMIHFRHYLFETLRNGRRRQDKFDPSKYKYSKLFPDLPDDFTHIIVVVKFSQQRTTKDVEHGNNFVLTAYQVSRS